MKKLFDIDGSVMVFLSRVMDMVILSLLWLVCSIPVITIGSATAALYYVTLKMVRGEEPGICSSFFHSFKNNLKQGVVLTLIFLVVGVILFADYLIMSGVENKMGYISSVIFLVLGVCVLNTMFFAFPLQAQFVNSIRETLKNAVLLAIQKNSNTILIFGLNMLPAIVAYFSPEIFIKTAPFWVLVAPAGIAYLCSTRFVKFFAPMMDTVDSEVL